MRIFLICIIAFCIFSGCSSRPKEPRHYHHSYHVVQKGDTLFSISWRYGIDVKQLAQWNNIPYPYTIYPGDRLRVNSTAPLSGNARKAKSKPPEATTARAVPPKNAPSTPIGDWRWPVKGKLLTKFSAQNNGIDISAKAGTSVSAASAGKVVYAGNGLRGYGNLLIIKHNASYFSAYAHNRRLLVAEGDKVRSGEKIAEVGSTGTNQTKLHFEIRKNGNPVNPLLYLPR